MLIFLFGEYGSMGKFYLSGARGRCMLETRMAGYNLIQDELFGGNAELFDTAPILIPSDTTMKMQSKADAILA